MTPRHRRRTGAPRSRAAGGSRRYPRALRVNEVLREIVAEELERLVDVDDRLSFVTVTAVDCDPDLRHATVLLSSLSDPELEALEELRVRLQAAVSAQVRLKRTPLLAFAADPSVALGQRVEEILRELREEER